MRSSILLTGVVQVVFATAVNAQCIHTEDQLIQGGGYTLDEFGRDVALEDTCAAIGSPGRNEVFLYDHDGTSWQLSQTLVGAWPFGISVALSGDLLVVGGANLYNVGQVRVYRFDGVRWSLADTMKAPQGVAGGLFGADVATDGTWIVVGATRNDICTTDAGAAYVYRDLGNDNWLLFDTLTASDCLTAPPDGYGEAVAVGNDNILVGSSRNDAVYSYDFDGVFWSETQILPKPEPTASAFGESLARNGSDLLVGSPKTLIGYQLGGTAYLYRRSGGSWVFDTRFESPNPISTRDFGKSVAVEGNLVLVGETQILGIDGEAHLFRNTGSGWVSHSTWFPSDAANTIAEFGTSCALSGGRALVSAPDAQTPFSIPGYVYAFDVPALSLDVDPSVSPTLDPVFLSTCGALPGSFALLYLVDVSGTPVLLKVARGSISDKGRWVLSGPVPPGVSGLAFTFLSLGFPETGQLGSSNQITLTIL